MIRLRQMWHGLVRAWSASTVETELVADTDIRFCLSTRRLQEQRGFRFIAGMILILTLIMSLALAGCDDPSSTKIREAGGDYSPVTHDILVGARFTGSTGSDRSYDDLQWEFQEETFLIPAGECGLPPVLANRLLPDGVQASVISGKWTVADDVITFTEITADGELTDQPFTIILRHLLQRYPSTRGLRTRDQFPSACPVDQIPRISLAPAGCHFGRYWPPRIEPRSMVLPQ